MTQDHQPYQQHYDDDRFWRKVQKYAAQTGEKVLDPALRLYYAAQDKDTPKWARAAIFGALGYFIFPLDAIPDVVPALGYSDDLGVLLAALATTAVYIKDEHVQKSQQKLHAWFHKQDADGPK
ncbi:MAG: DUF1232 domain-containing protein [Neisseriaceae bacterium]|nr:DUF1232 domain-containing protein [Neisseriaceae bacterium]MBP6862758.1 DUF1232 domain-containing protein [Neisseriaceae bacterium]